MKNKPQNHSAATLQGGAVAHSDIIPPIVPRQVSRKAGAKAAAQTSEPSKETTSQQECQLVGISCTSPMGFISSIINLSKRLFCRESSKGHLQVAGFPYRNLSQDEYDLIMRFQAQDAIWKERLRLLAAYQALWKQCLEKLRS